MGNELRVLRKDRLNTWYTYNGERSYLVISIDQIKWPHFVYIHGKLPMCKKLLDFQDGALIEVSFDEIGRRDVYREENIILRLEHCRVERKWIDNLVTPFEPPYNLDLVQHVAINLKISANINFLFEDENGQ